MLIMSGDTDSNLGLTLPGLTFTTNGSAAACCDGIFQELKIGQKNVNSIFKGYTNKFL